MSEQPNVKKMTAAEFLLQNQKTHDSMESLLQSCVKELQITRDSVRKVYNKLARSGSISLQIEREVEREIDRQVTAREALENKAARYMSTVTSNVEKNKAVLELLSEEILKELRNKNFSQTKIHPLSTKENNFGILQLSDLHFNSSIELTGNTFDFSVASKRLYKFAQEAKKYFKANGVKKVLVAFTGDLISGDRRQEELVSNVTNRATAVFSAVDILQQLELDLNSEFNLVNAYVVGNESRITQEVGFSTNMITDSYDSLIFNILQGLFSYNSGITFVTGNPAELVVEFGGKKILLTHGYAQKGHAETFVTGIRSRWANKGVNIDYVLMGHLHSAYISDFFGRSSALAGSSSYSEFNLNLSSRASQNLYIVNKDGVHGTKIDLQDYTDDCYSFRNPEEVHAITQSNVIHIC